jgi:hypothetical protein
VGRQEHQVFLELRVGESSEPKGRLRLPAADPALRESLQGLPTTFALPGEAVDRLRAAAAQVLRESPAFERFVGSLATPR